MQQQQQQRVSEVQPVGPSIPRDDWRGVALRPSPWRLLAPAFSIALLTWLIVHASQRSPNPSAGTRPDAALVHALGAETGDDLAPRPPGAGPAAARPVGDPSTVSPPSEVGIKAGLKTRRSVGAVDLLGGSKAPAFGGLGGYDR